MFARVRTCICIEVVRVVIGCHRQGGREAEAAQGGPGVRPRGWLTRTTKRGQQWFLS